MKVKGIGGKEASVLVNAALSLCSSDTMVI
jgi:hypothetical protein